MGDEFYASIKLVTGEEIFSLISIDENNGDPIIILQNPVIMKTVSNDYGFFVKIKPWMEIPKDDFYLIKSDKIVTMTEVSDSMTINFYNKYLDNNDNEINIDGRVKISTDMGYICSVDEARNKLENLYNKINDPKDFIDT
jgi:hypothetical protein